MKTTAKCGKLTFSKAVNKSLPCINVKGHNGRCTPDLTGQKIGNALVIKIGPRYKPPCHEKYHGKSPGMMTWVVLQQGVERKVQNSSLSSGMCQGIRIKNAQGLLGHPLSETSPEYKTVSKHWHVLYGKNPFPTYKGMPFFDEWNPSKGGSYGAGAKWIIDNLGHKPNSAWSMDIIKHELGFVPGNLRWALHSSQQQNKQHKKLGTFTLQELRVEAKRRGYKLVII